MFNSLSPSLDVDTKDLKNIWIHDHRFLKNKCGCRFSLVQDAAWKQGRRPTDHPPSVHTSSMPSHFLIRSLRKGGNLQRADEPTNPHSFEMRRETGALGGNPRSQGVEHANSSQTAPEVRIEAGSPSSSSDLEIIFLSP